MKSTIAVCLSLTDMKHFVLQCVRYNGRKTIETDQGLTRYGWATFSDTAESHMLIRNGKATKVTAAGTKLLVMNCVFAILICFESI